MRALAIVRARQSRDADAEFAAIRREDAQARAKTPHVHQVMDAIEDVLMVERDIPRREMLGKFLDTLSAFASKDVDIAAKPAEEWLELLRKGPQLCPCRPLSPCYFHDASLTPAWRKP